MSYFVIFGLLSTFMMLLSRTSYCISVMQGRTRPHAFSWFIWGVISSIGFAAQWAEGAGAGSWARGFGALTCFLLVGLGLWRGEKNITRGDWITLAIALAAIPLWVITETPFWSVVLVCMIDCIGYFPTIRKSWNKPREEIALSYGLSCMGAFFSLVAIEHYTPSTWLYPLVLVLSNGGMAAFLLLRRRKTAEIQPVLA